MKNKYVFCLLIIVFTTAITRAGHPPLSHSQMQEDFNQFVDIVKTYNPQLGIREAVTDYNVLAMIEKQRYCLDTVTTISNFLGLMRETVNCLIDMHAYAIDWHTPSWLVNYMNSSVFLDSINTEKCISLIPEFLHFDLKKTPIFSFGNFLTYLDGKYYTLGKIRLMGEILDVSFGQSELLGVGNKTIDEYVWANIQKNKGQYTRWDFECKKYYSSCLTFDKIDTLYLREVKSGRDIAIPLAEITGFSFKNPRMYGVSKHQMKTQLTPVVHYFSRQQLLYIYLPNMTPGLDTAIICMIEKVAWGKPLQKVVFDVRDNIGGSDYVWMNLIAKITGDSINLPCHIAIRHEEPLKQHYITNEEKYLYRDTTLFEQKFIVFDKDWSHFVPDSDNIGFKGTFYVLENKESLSASRSLSSICRYSSRFVSIGMPSGLLSGRGSGPMFFQLKHSGFTFGMECDWDITGVRDRVDYYQDLPEIILKLSLQEASRIHFLSNTRVTKSKKYLLKKDPGFKTILHHVK
jgi:hypothetical protein